MKKVVVFGIALLFATSVHADEIRRRKELKIQEEIAKLEAEADILEKKLKDTKIKRWQDKRNAIAQKEAFQDLWEGLKRDIDQLVVKKDKKDELKYKFEEVLDKENIILQERTDQLDAFLSNLNEKKNDLEKIIQAGFNHEIAEKTLEFNKIPSTIKQENVSEAIEAVFNIHLDMYKQGESSELIRENFTYTFDPLAYEKGVESVAKREASIGLRLGNFYKGLISTEENKVAVLAKTGMIGEDTWRFLENVSEETKKDMNIVKDALVNGGLKGTVMVPMDVLLKKATTAGYVNRADNNFWSKLLAELKAAGFAIYLIGFAVAVSILIIIQKVMVFGRSGSGAKRIYRKASKMVAEQKYEEALAYCKKKKTSTAKLLAIIIENKDLTRHEIEELVHELMLSEIPRFEKNINTVNIFAAASPLAGLLGTVSGMVALFAAITMHGTGDPKIMASGISEAMLSTKWGLLGAIPLLMIYNILNNRAEKHINEMEVYSSKLINEMLIKVPA